MTESVMVDSGPEGDGRIRIICGPYLFLFMEDERGKAKMVGFQFSEHRLQDADIPPQFFNPAARRAHIMLSDRRKKALAGV